MKSSRQVNKLNMLLIDFKWQWKKKGQIVEHLNKGNSGCFAIALFYFIRANHRIDVKLQFEGKGST